MSDQNKATLLAANAAVSHGDNEGFLKFCDEGIRWETVGGDVLQGKPAVREWMRTAYAEPPRFSVSELVAENDLVVALGRITVKGVDGKDEESQYSDVWRFRDGKMVELRAFVVG